MKKIVRIVKKGDDDSNLFYWLSLGPVQRLKELEKMRQEINLQFYHDTRQGLQRVYRIVKRA